MPSTSKVFVTSETRPHFDRVSSGVVEAADSLKQSFRAFHWIPRVKNCTVMLWRGGYATLGNTFGYPDILFS